MKNVGSVYLLRVAIDPSEFSVDEEAALSLHYVFQHTFLAALDLIDRGKGKRADYQ